MDLMTVALRLLKDNPDLPRVAPEVLAEWLSREVLDRIVSMMKREWDEHVRNR